MNEKNLEELYDRIFVARQPIFTADMHIWGYELLFRHGESSATAEFLDGDQATTQVIADGFSLATRRMRADARALVNFTRNLLLGDAPYILPSDRCVVEILETVQPEAEVMDACRKLKKSGYTLALDDFVGDPGFEPLCEMADIIKVDILGRGPAEVKEIVQGLGPYKAQLLAEKVETREMFAVCKKLGFRYFQGYFFSKPEVIPGRKISASQATKIKLLKELNVPETELDRLTQIIQTDLAISYKLLQYINSARFFLQSKVESIQRATVMLGRQNLRQWLQVVILSDLNTTDKAQELVRISVQRGRFLQLLAEGHPAPFGPASMFLLGFFSLLDAILGQVMEDILHEVALDTDLKEVLTNPKSQDAVWIDLARELDRGHWQGMESLARDMGISMSLINHAVASAAAWTDEIMASGS